MLPYPCAPYSEEVLCTILRHTVKVERQVCHGENLLAHYMVVLIVRVFVLSAFSFTNGGHDQHEVVDKSKVILTAFAAI